jgi:hypothetical protein
MKHRITTLSMGLPCQEAADNTVWYETFDTLQP